MGAGRWRGLISDIPELTRLESVDPSEHIPLLMDRHFIPGASSLQEKSKVHRQIELCKNVQGQRSLNWVKS